MEVVARRGALALIVELGDVSKRGLWRDAGSQPLAHGLALSLGEDELAEAEAPAGRGVIAVVGVKKMLFS